MRVKMSKQLPPAPTASAIGPCPTIIQIVGRPGTGSLPRTIAPPDHLSYVKECAFHADREMMRVVTPPVPPNFPEETGLKGRCEGREGVLMK